ncbi:SLC13 family permease [Nitrincola iocasae]|uniref:SLC13 family permease n=1 Tax=Nitrincola iocasae TaxID=2614693 RepID=A0A5J6LF83_9GAMM|nr:SLC13 family permease [Nitrincola iocasae]QEW07290.1 SLC13 family permease [Nitrincola iocasae]
MTQDQSMILVILLATMAMFLWGRWRHDMVAGATLLACVLAGLVDAADAFSGFSHPAVVTVACVLVLSRALQTSGAVDILARHALPKSAGVTLSIAALTGLGALLSGFMNNVGAMALLMPVAMQMSGRLGLSSGQVLMPLAFGTILGGMTTLIGTPPNLIVSGFRSELETASAFSMFDFTLVGLPVAVVCVLFVALLGWRLVPVRKNGVSESFDTGAYVTEVRVPEKSKAANLLLRDIEKVLDEADAQVIALVRNEVKINAPSYGRKVLANDILIIEAEVESLADVLSSLGLKLEEAEEDEDSSEDNQEDDDKESASSVDIVLVELVVREESQLVGRSAKSMLLRTRYGINLLALSREDRKSHARLRTMKIKAGDLLLMQGPQDAVMEFASDYSCIPLAERDLNIPDKNKAITASVILIAAIALAALGILPTAIAFALGVLASMATKTLPLRSIYTAIDWPVIVLLGALIPVANAMESTGTAHLIADFLLGTLAQGNSVIALGLILVVTMFLSDVMNNAATAAVMCPIALGTASTLGLNPDAFLMAVAIGASCAFLTPIGHQNNTLILGPGGFRFGDYWRLGLPVELLVCAVSVPLLLVFWPL